MAAGLITEASSLAFPEGATSDELNFTIDRDGLIRKRRLGFDKLVTDFTITATNPKVENALYWRGPSLVVVIVTDETPQTTLRFHAVDADFTFINEVVIASGIVNTQVAQTTDLLTITTNNGDSPILCEHNSVTQIISVGSVSLYVRDFELVDDGLGASERTVTLTDNHKYNLYNSTWYQTKADFNDASTRKNVATAYFDTEAVYPSNADIASVGIIDDGAGNIVFDAGYVKDSEIGESIAPRGHFVYNINNINRAAKLAAPLTSSAPSTTITSLGTVSLVGIPTFNPDDLIPAPDAPDGGGGTDPYDGFDPFDPFTEIP